MPSELKTLMVAEIEKRIGSSEALVLVGMTGLKGVETAAIRRKVKESGARLFHLKNTLARIVFERKGLAGLEDYLVGPTAVLYGDDPVAVAKLAKEFAKEYPEKFEMRGGYLVGRICAPEEVKAMADMPPYEEMVATMLATLASPVTNLLAAVSSPVSNLLNVLEQVRESKEESKAS